MPQFSGANASARAATLTDASGQRGDNLFVAFLNAHPPTLFLNDPLDGSWRQPEPHPGGNVLAIRGRIEAVDWAASRASAREKPVAGRGRKKAKSMFEYVESRLKSEKVDVLFFDDSSNEVADYVAVEIFRENAGSFSCSTARPPVDRSRQRRPHPFQRPRRRPVEVLGQSIKCRRWLEPRNSSRSSCSEPKQRSSPSLSSETPP